MSRHRWVEEEVRWRFRARVGQRVVYVVGAIVALALLFRS